MLTSKHTCSEDAGQVADLRPFSSERAWQDYELLRGAVRWNVHSLACDRVDDCHCQGVGSGLRGHRPEIVLLSRVARLHQLLLSDASSGGRVPGSSASVLADMQDDWQDHSVATSLGVTIL